MSVQLPDEYIAYYESGAPRYGFTDLDFAGYFDLQPIELIGALNRDIGIRESAPGFLAFASNGGGEILAFDAQGKVYAIPLIGMASDTAILVAESWSAYVSHIEQDT